MEHAGSNGENRMRQSQATDNSVRDHPQKATVCGGIITIVMKVGNKIAGSYCLQQSQWDAARNSPTFNENYNRRELIGGLYCKLFPGDYDDDPCQAERIIDSQICAIKKALEKLGKAA
jgi:hypothetical protein